MLRRVLTVGLVLPAVAVVATSGPAPAAGQPECRGHAATIVGTAGDDRLTGTRGADVVVGLGGNDVLRGLGGDDVLCGGPGADDLAGGGGDDRLYGGSDEQVARGRRTIVAGDLLEGGAGDDLLNAGPDYQRGRLAIRRSNIVSYRHSPRAVSVDLRRRSAHGQGHDVVVPSRRLEVDGSRYADVLLGSRLPETLDGGRGDDRLSGRAGRDAVLDYHGDDTLSGGDGPDLVISTAGADTVAGDDGRDWLIAASPAATTLLGGAGFDYLSRQIRPGATGVIDGGPGDNQLELDPQLWFDARRTAALDAATGTAVVTAGERTHTTTFSNVGAFTLWGARWAFRGTEGDDFVQVLEGRLDAQAFGGDDFMIGGERRDVLDGGDGTDAAWGGGGQNTCLNTETGSCTGYPWEETDRRSSLAAGGWTGLAADVPDRLVSRWMSHPADEPLAGLGTGNTPQPTPTVRLDGSILVR